MSNLLEKASIITTPTAYSDGVLHSVKPSESPYADFTFTRNDAGTRVNASGNIESVGVDLPRIDYRGGSGSWLLEPQSTNLCSDYLFLSAVNGGVVTLNSAISPDGTQNATKVNFSSGNNNSGGKISFGSSASASTEYTFSFYAKNLSGDGTFRLRIDTDVVAVLVNQNFTATSEWVRYTHTFTTDALSSSFSSNSRFRKSTTTDNNEVLFYGMQLEERSFATSVIPTSGGTGTRAEDIATDAGSSDLISSTEGVLYLEIAALTSINNFESITLSNGGITERVRFMLSNTENRISIQVETGNGSGFFRNYTLSDVTAFNKIAIKYKQDDYVIWINGVEEITVTTAAVPTLNELNFTAGSSSGGKFIGNVKCVAVFKEALTDAELTCLTTI